MHANELYPGPRGALLPEIAPSPFTGNAEETTPSSNDAAPPAGMVDPAQVPAPMTESTPVAPDCPGLSRLWDEEDSSDAASWSVDVFDELELAPAQLPEAEPWLEPEPATQGSTDPASNDAAELPGSAVQVLH